MICIRNWCVQSAMNVKLMDMVSKDIHKWTMGRYTLMFDEHTFFVFDNEKEERMTALETTERLNKQQDTIFKLQDICGKSDYENAKLKIENKRLQEENEQLRKQCFELEKDYVIETSDISDKIYLDDEIKELEQKYSVTDE